MLEESSSLFPVLFVSLLRFLLFKSNFYKGFTCITNHIVLHKKELLDTYSSLLSRIYSEEVQRIQKEDVVIIETTLCKARESEVNTYEFALVSIAFYLKKITLDEYIELYIRNQFTLNNDVLSLHFEHLGRKYLEEQLFSESYQCFMNAYQVIPTLQRKMFCCVLMNYFDQTTLQITKEDCCDTVYGRILRYYFYKQEEQCNHLLREYLAIKLLPLVSASYNVLLEEEMRILCSHHHAKRQEEVLLELLNV